MTRSELITCRSADILTCRPENLADLKKIVLTMDQPVQKRIAHYMDQVQNPYLFRVDDLIVKVTFNGKQDLSSALAGLMMPR